MVKYKFKLIKIFISTLFLIFSHQYLTKADDVTELQINMYSVGDNLIEFKSKKLIEEKEKFFFPGSKKFYRISFPIEDENYDYVAFYLKNNDKKYKIYSLEGFKFLNYSECKKKMKSIKNSMENFFSDNFISQRNEEPHSFDKSNESMVTMIDFIGPDDYSISRIICTDWSKKMEGDGYADNLAIYLQLKEFSNFMLTEAYQ